MSGNVTNPYNKSYIATYLGQQVKVVDTVDDNEVIIQFDDGSEKKVSKFMLMSTSIFFYNQDEIDKNNKKIEEYKALAKEAEAEKSVLWKQIKELNQHMRSKYSEWGTKFLHAMNSEQKEECKDLRGKILDLKFEVVARNNDSLGYTLDAFRCACRNMGLFG